MAWSQLVLLLFIVKVIFCTETFRTNGATTGLIRYVNTIGDSSRGRCVCGFCENCVCTINGVQYSTDATWAAIVVEELHFKDKKVAVKWPDAPLDLTEPPGHPGLGTIDGKQEPLLHLKRYPERSLLKTTRFLLFDRFDFRKKPQEIHYNKETLLKTLPAYERLFFVIHGWLGSVTDAHFVSLMETLIDYLPLDNPGVVLVDWRTGANFNRNLCSAQKWLSCVYDRAAANVVLVGRQVGLLTHMVVKSTLLDTKRVHYIGYGLGAQVAHFAAKWFQDMPHMWPGSNGPFHLRSIGRLTALDPSARHFQGFGGSHVTNEDAYFVDAIHTSFVQMDGSLVDTLQGHVGMSISVGSIDFYPNGGHRQPSCSGAKGVDTTCSHFAAIFYFLESLKRGLSRNTFASIPCRSWSQFGACKRLTASLDNPYSSSMGIEAQQYKGHGDHYLRYLRNFTTSLQRKATRKRNNKLQSTLRGSKAPFFPRPQPKYRADVAPSARIDDQEHCGLFKAPPNEGRSFEGNVAYLGQFPWAVALVDITVDDEGKYNGTVGVAFCGGTILSPEWILTAAHCLDDKEEDDWVLIAFATIDLRDVILGVNAVMYQIQMYTYDEDPIPTYFQHEDYEPLAGPCDFRDQSDDIALMRLEPQYKIPIPQNPDRIDGIVNRVCYKQREKLKFPPFMTYQIAGYGFTKTLKKNEKDNDPNKWLLWIEGKRLARAECIAHQLARNTDATDPGRFCGANNIPPYPITCEGDSGSGVVTIRRFNEGEPLRAYLVGVVIKGPRCIYFARTQPIILGGQTVRRADPDTFINVHFYHQWIVDTIEHNS